MEVGSSGRGAHGGASTRNDPTVGVMPQTVGGGDGGDGGGNDAKRRKDIQEAMIAAERDRAIRADSVRQDLALNLPPRLELPDGEEPYGAHSDLHLRNPDQVRSRGTNSESETESGRARAGSSFSFTTL